MIALSAASLWNAVSRKRLEIQAFSFTKRRTLSLEVKICKFLASLTHYESKNSGGSTIRYFWIFVTSRKNSPSKRGQVQNLSSHKATTIRTLTRRAQLVCNSPDSIVKMSFICVKIKKITFISIAAHFASLWNRGLRRLGNGKHITVVRRKWRNAKKRSHKTMANQQWFPHHQKTSGTVDNNYVF